MVSELFKKLPDLAAAKELLANIPDEKRLRLISGIVAEIGKLPNNPEQLKAIGEVLKLIQTTDIEKLQVLAGMVANISRLVKFLPPGGLEGLNISEMARELHKE